MKRVLCVDDQQVGLEIRKLLLEASGFRVLTACDGQAALEAIRTEVVDLVILDYRLAETTGDVLAKQLKEQRPGVPVLLLSGYPEVPASAIAAVDHFLPKGGSAQVFLEAVEVLLGLRKEVRPSTDETISASRDIIRKSVELTKKSASVRQNSAEARKKQA